MSNETKLRIHNITAKALKYGRETWVSNKRYEQRLEAAKMRCLRSLLGYAKFDLQGNVDIRKCFSNCGPRRSTGSFRRKSIAKKCVKHRTNEKYTHTCLCYNCLCWLTFNKKQANYVFP
jgi:hypothetical protein